MRNYSQDQCENLNQIPRYVRNPSSQEKGLRYRARSPTNQPDWTARPKSSDKASLDLVPNYEHPALPYYVVPVLYVPQKVLPNQEILPSNSFQSTNKSLFADYVHQTKQQRRFLVKEYDMPYVTCTIDPQFAVGYQRSPPDIFADHYAHPSLANKSNSFVYKEEEITEVEEEEEEEVENANYEAECTVSTTSDGEEEEEEEEEEEDEINVVEPTVYEENYDTKHIRHLTSHPTYRCYQNNHLYSRPNKSMQIIDPPQRNYIPRNIPIARKTSPILLPAGSVNYGGDVYRNQIFLKPNFDQSNYSFYQTDPFHQTNPLRYENHQTYNLSAEPKNLKAKTNYTLMQRCGVNRTEPNKLPEFWPSTNQGCELKSEKKLTCEDILRNYMQDKQISLESIRRTSESVTSDDTASIKRSSTSFHTPPCKECPSSQIEDVTVVETEMSAKLESQWDSKSFDNSKATNPDDGKMLKTTQSTYTQSENSSTISMCITNTNSKERTDSAPANFANTLSMTVVAVNTSSESSTLKRISSSSLKEEQREPRTPCTTPVTSQSILDTKSTQTIDSATVPSTSTVSTQTEPKSTMPEEKVMDLGNLLRNKESAKTLPDIDIFKPLTKPRDFTPSTFFQKFRKQSKPYAGVENVKEKKTKPEGGPQKPAAAPRLPLKPSTINQSKLKKTKKK